MRRVFVLLLLFVTACSDSGQELAPTTSPDPTQPPATTSTTAPSPTTTEGPTASSSTSTAPTTTTTLPPLQSLEYQEVVEIDFPIQLVPRNESSSLLATKDGQIYWFVDGQVDSEPVLDLSDLIRNEGERGLLSIVVHPDNDGRLFVHYSANDGDTVVEEYTISESGQITPEPVRQLLRLDQPARNHNGGMLQFGPSGEVLYLGLGDGGGSNDRFGNGQDTGTLLGGLVRFEVQFESPGDVSEGVLHQYGLRNPWRFAIDGDRIYIADVGQNAYEEVSVATLEEGLNYGWPITEGLHCFRPSSGCDTAGITLPVVEVGHGDAATCSITGGYVYRGSAIPEVGGHYFYSDYCGGYLRSFRFEGGEALDQTDWTAQVGVPGNVASFGLDHDGEIYVLTTDRVLKVVAAR